mmetsp:Transcript_14060/g.44257  ORF Transcript_14060/g.44257 Transcript_14060/m.44257 type:complete len:386 (+) Transcript_14060:905-2062(+)
MYVYKVTVGKGTDARGRGGPLSSRWQQGPLEGTQVKRPHVCEDAVPVRSVSVARLEPLAAANEGKAIARQCNERAARPGRRHTGGRSANWLRVLVTGAVHVRSPRTSFAPTHADRCPLTGFTRQVYRYLRHVVYFLGDSAAVNGAVRPFAAGHEFGPLERGEVEPPQVVEVAFSLTAAPHVQEPAKLRVCHARSRRRSGTAGRGDGGPGVRSKVENGKVVVHARHVVQVVAAPQVALAVVARTGVARSRDRHGRRGGFNRGPSVRVKAKQCPVVHGWVWLERVFFAAKDGNSVLADRQLHVLLPKTKAATTKGTDNAAPSPRKARHAEGGPEQGQRRFHLALAVAWAQQLPQPIVKDGLFYPVVAHGSTAQQTPPLYDGKAPSVH